ncbi:hemoglobin [Spirosoma lacussanchae]|uniref:group III truncated hemoglobin n=1 Tax=Spirosoma lacussanchae TaxID=1884249 RepID=UPI0011095F9B|nr:group III truncated hemoglobin [Spirosoma lacussanchae]
MTDTTAPVLHDIDTKADIAYLLDRFYERVRQDPDLGYIFDGVAQVNWPEHLPRINAFWTNLLLGGDGSYQGNPMRAHVDLARKTPITPAHFDRWLALFTQTLTDCFAGERAREALLRAQAIAAVMQSRLYSAGLLETD